LRAERCSRGADTAARSAKDPNSGEFGYTLRCSTERQGVCFLDPFIQGSFTNTADERRDARNQTGSLDPNTTIRQF
jgi:hypothetical protein